MADLYYYEEGYIEAKYYAYVADAAVDMTSYFEEGYIEAYFYEQQNGVAVLTFEGDIVNIIVEASGSWTSEFSQSASGTNIKPLSSTIASEFAQSADNLRLRPLDSSLSSEFAHTALVGKIQQAEAAFTGAFSPTLTADAFKNHTAVIESISAMTVDAVVGRSGNVLLEHIANLNAMAIKDAVSSATLASTSSQTTNITKTLQYQADISATTALASNSGKLKTVAVTSNISSTLFVSRYLNGRPRSFTTTGTVNFTTNSKFGSHALSCAAGNNFAQASSSKDYNTWRTIDFWTYITAPGGGGGNYILTTSQWSVYNFNMSPVGQWRVGLNVSSGGALSDVITATGWVHIRILRETGAYTAYVNGQKIGWSGLYNISTTALSAVNETLKIGNTDLYNLTCVVDELLITNNLLNTSSSNTITVPSSPWTFTDQSNVNILSHFNNVLNDDVSITQTAQSNVSAVCSISAQADPNTKSATANVTATASQTTIAIKIIEAFTDLSTQADLNAVNTKIKQFSSALETIASLQDGLARIRYGESSQNSLFSPSVTVVATKSGEILLQPEFSVTVNANSFTEVPAALSSQFAIIAGVDGVTRITSVALASAFQITDNLGKLQTATVNISGALNAQITANYFEGTALLAPMTVTMSATAVKTARITKTLSVVATVASTGFEAPADPGPVATLKPYGLWHFDSFTPIYGLPPNDNIIQGYQTYDSYDATRFMWATQNTTQSKFGGSSLDSPSAITAGVVAGTIDAPTIGSGNFTADFWYYWVDPTGTPAGFGRAIGVPNSNGSAVLYEIRTYALNGGALLINGSTAYTFSLSGWQHLALQRNGTALTLWRDGQLLTTQTVSQDGVGTRWAVDTVRSGNTNYSSRGFVDELRIRPIAGYSTTFTPPTAAYDLEYDILDLKQLYAILEPRFVVDADFIKVVFLQAGLLAGTFTQTAAVSRTRYFNSTLNTQSTVYANAGKAAVASVTVNAASTVQASVSRTRLAETSMSVACTTTCAPTRVRYHAANLTATATVATQAVKRTGNVIAVESTVAQTTQGLRIRYAGADFSAFNSTVTAAVKNATGTVTLESQFAQTTTAEKNAVGVIALVSESAVTPNTTQAKIVGFAATVVSSSTQETIGDRIQPAGSDMLSEFAQSTNTNDSKITRIVSVITSTATVTVSADRSRSVISLQASAGTLTCQNDTIRFGSAQLQSQFYDFIASPTFIVRITADFTAFNTQLTLGEVINIDPYLTLWIKPESRLREITSETRIITILQETRVNIIEGYSQ